MRSELLVLGVLLQLLVPRPVERVSTCRITELRNRHVLQDLPCTLNFKGSVLQAASIEPNIHQVTGHWQIGDAGVNAHPLWRSCLAITHRSGKEVSLCSQESLRDLGV